MGGGPCFSMLAGLRGGALLPLDDQYQEIRRQLWLATDGAYKRAVEQLAQKRAALQNQTRAEHLPDFAKEPPAVLSDVVPAPPLDRAAAEALVRGLSAAFRAFPEVYSSGVSWSAGVARTRYLNSEGSAFTRSSPWLVLGIQASTQAVDGMPLGDAIAFYGGTPSDLPTRESLLDSVRALATRLTRLRQTPVAELYNGPVLFEGDAAAELFNELFAPRLGAWLRHRGATARQRHHRRYGRRRLRHARAARRGGGEALPRRTRRADPQCLRLGPHGRELQEHRGRLTVPHGVHQPVPQRGRHE